MVALGLKVGLALIGAQFSFFNHPPYAASTPTPDAILGYSAGARHTNFRDQERVFKSIAAAAPRRVKEFRYGTTAELRPLRIFAVSSESNIANLEQIRLDHEKLALGTGNPEKVVPIVWINECIHGDETASFESAMWTYYNLVASRSPEIEEALKKVVVLINPVYNPDGHERYVVFYNSIATGSPSSFAFEKREPSIVYGRTNHYRFDMNRDRVAFSQTETREEFSEMLRWNPQVYIDQHGQVASYFFPPEPMAINLNVDRARNAKWTEFFGRAIGKAFDQSAMSYFVKDTFDLYYPGYLDSSTTLSGAVGMTHETDGGRVLASERSDGSVLTLRQGMTKHFTSALTVVQASASRSEELMADYASFKKRVVSGQAAGKFQRVVLTSADVRPLERLRKHLAFAGIASYFAKPFSQSDAHDYWSPAAGSVQFAGNPLVIDMAQPQGALAKALLEPQSSFEPEFIAAQIRKKKDAPEGEKYPGPESPEFYDLTGWALPYAYDLKAWWCESSPKLIRAQPIFAESPRLPSEAAGYALRYSDENDVLAVFDCLASGARAMVTTHPMRLGNAKYDKGTFIFPGGRNEVGYEATLRQVAQKRGVVFEPLVSTYPEEGREGPGSESMMELKRPSVAVVMGQGDRLSECGPMWYLLERQFQVPFTFISEDELSGDLSSFSAVVIPSGSNFSRADRFREWISAGNVAVLLGNPRGASIFQELTEKHGDIQELPGSLFRAELDQRSFLADGYGASELAVPMEGSTFFSRRKEGGSVIYLSDKDSSKLLSGWEWPDDTEKNMAGALFLQDIPVGRGHAIVFAQDPTSRAMWPGLDKLLLNGILLGSAH